MACLNLPKQTPWTKKLRPTSKNKYCGFIRSMKDKGRCNISSYLFQDKHLEDVSLLMLVVPF